MSDPVHAPDGSIRLVAHDRGWAAVYAREAARIRSALGPDALVVEHVGSTSVPGLVAKPIIDIVLAVVDSRDEPAYAPRLVRAGYVLRIREPDWHEHRLFKRSATALNLRASTAGDPATALNLHVFTAGDPEIARMIAFRDRLRNDPRDRERYAAVKRTLAARSWPRVQDYADAKSEVVEEILSRA